MDPEQGYDIKLKEVESIVDLIIQKMDNNTVLIVAGSHGIMSDGTHEALSNGHTRSMLFAYTKLGFPMRYSKPSQMLNQIDVSSMISTVLDVPIPESSLENVGFQFLQYNSSQSIVTKGI